MSPAKTKKNNEVAQVGRFGLVGILNTAVDFIILNLLVRTILPRNEVFFTILGKPISGIMIAGVISGTIAMINSFVFNQRFTFRAKKVGNREIILFFAITMFGIYAIRPIILNFFSAVWLWPANLAYTIGQVLHLPMDQAFYTDNVALAAAIAIVLVYNYVLYKKLVFKK